VPSLVEDPDGTLRALVDHLGYDLEPSILIGGWATYLRVGGPMSHDIDLIIGDDSVRQKLQDRLDDLSRSNHLQGEKWSGEVDGVHLDIYIPHKSKLGARLRLRVEVLARHVEPAEDLQQRWLLLTIEAHIVSKMAALLDRHATVKGAKDANELLALIGVGVDAQKAVGILMDATAGPIDDVPAHIGDAFDLIAQRADTNRNQRKRLAQQRREWLDHAATALRRRATPGAERPSLQ
jgi:hypothetical protein